MKLPSIRGRRWTITLTPTLIATHIGAAVLGATLVAPAPADAATNATPPRPYGGCIEVLQDFPAYLNTPGADDCRARGWTIRARLVVGPAGYVRYSALPHCRLEDGSGQRSACSWNFDKSTNPDGNGRGRMYWLDRHDHTHYVKGWR